MRLAIAASLLSVFPLCAELQLVSGQGQMVLEQFPSAPLAVRAVDTAGRPIAGLPVSWTITEGRGTLVRGTGEQTDADGYAWVRFVGTDIQPGTSWEQSTITASSSQGVVSFIITTIQSRLNSGPAPQPSVQYLGAGELKGPAGSTITGAFVVQVAASAGIRLGQGIPNVGIRLAPPEGVDPATAPFGTCRAPGGVLMTDSRGLATCDLVLNRNVGTGSFTALVGEMVRSRNVALEITPGETCALTVSANIHNFSSAGGLGTATVSSTQGCPWTASSATPWITVAAGAIGTGNGTFQFTVAANAGGARTGTITVGNQTLTITQAAANVVGGPLMFSTSTVLPPATVGAAYSIGIHVTGGTPPYTWSSSQLMPPGLSLNSSTGVLSGVPSNAGTASLPVVVRDATGAQISQVFTLQIQTAGTNPGTGGPLVITTTSFANGSVGVPYSAPLTASGGCQNPFAGGPSFTLVSGSLPPGLTLQSATGGAQVSGTPAVAGVYRFAVRAADSCGAASTREFTITIGTAPAAGAMTATPASVGFTAAQGGTQILEQSISLASGTTSIAYTAVASMNEGNWLSVSPGAATTPATLVVRVSNYADLPARTYSGTITVISQASNSPLTIPVTLTVGSAQGAANLTADPPSLTLAPQSGATAPIDTTVTVGSSGAPLTFSVSATSAQGWLAVTQSGSTTPGSLRVRVQNYATLAPGTYQGTVSVTSAQAANSPLLIPVTLTVPVAATPAISPLSLGFEWQPGSAVPPEQAITINSLGGPMSFTAVAGTRSGGQWLAIDRTAGTAPATLQVSVNPAGLAPGTYQGSVSITPDTPRTPVVVSVTLRVTQSGPQIGSVTNAASYLPGPIAPGEIVTLFGSNLGPASLTTLRLDPAGMIETALAGTRVWFEDQLAPIVHTSISQVTVVAPYAIAGRPTVNIVVEYNGVRSEARAVPVAASAPGLFTVGGGTQGAILNEDSTPNSPQNGAMPGSWVSLFATGEGELAPALAAGAIATAGSGARPVLPIRVAIGGREAEVAYAGPAPGLLVGLMQVNVRIPEDTPQGPAAVVLTVGQASSQAGVTVHVRR